MSDYTPQLKKYLDQAGCYFDRQGKRDHEIWYSPITDVRLVVDNAIKSRHTANAVLNKLDYPKNSNMILMCY